MDSVLSRQVTKAAIALGLAVTALGASANDLITNGDFETGSYAGWNVAVQAGSSGGLNIVANGTGASPISNNPYQANASGGRFFSISDQTGPGSYSLTQAFTLTSASTVTVSFQLFANDWAGEIYNSGRDYTGSANENAEVDILAGGADPFTNAASDIVSTLYGPGADDLGGNPNPWQSYSSSLSLAAGTYQIRFAETDNQSFFQLGVDNVSVSTSAVPEPQSLLLMLAGVGATLVAVRRKRGIGR